MLDRSVLIDEKTDPASHVSLRHFRAVSLGDFAVGISEQREVQVVFANEALMTVRIVEADADHLDIIFLEVAHGVTEAASFGGASRRLIFGIKIEQDRMFADLVGEFPRFAI